MEVYLRKCTKSRDTGEQVLLRSGSATASRIGYIGERPSVMVAKGLGVLSSTPSSGLGWEAVDHCIWWWCRSVWFRGNVADRAVQPSGVWS